MKPRSCKRSLRGNQLIDIEQFKILTVVNALDPVVDMHSVPSLNNLCRASDLEELTLAY